MRLELLFVYHHSHQFDVRISLEPSGIQFKYLLDYAPNAVQPIIFGDGVELRS